jgi:hypothetical protein
MQVGCTVLRCLHSGSASSHSCICQPGAGLQVSLRLSRLWAQGPLEDKMESAREHASPPSPTCWLINPPPPAVYEMGGASIDGTNAGMELFHL